MKYEREYEFIKNIAKDAYEQVIKGHQFVANDKTEKDLVTTLDLACEKFIISKIKENFSTDTIISEETNYDVKLAGRSWTVDPIDGTNNFANNLPIWVIQVAFVVDGEVQCSVVYAPVLNEIVYSHKGEGVYLNGEKLGALQEVPNNQLIIDDSIGRNRKKLFFNEKTDPLYLRRRCFGSAGYFMASVALGRLGGAFFECKNLWDILPGKLLCEERGLKFYQFEREGTHFCIVLNNQKFVDALDILKEEGLE